MSPNCVPTMITTIGIDLGKNTFHLVGLDRRGAIISQLKLLRSQLERRLANVPSYRHSHVAQCLGEAEPAE